MFIELKSVSYAYSPDTSYCVNALDNVSITINDGEFVGIMGQTGCGKSTLIQIIAGLIEPTSGTVLFDNQNIHAKKFNQRVLRENIGVVFQFPEYQLFETTVYRDVAFALKHTKLGKDEVQCRVREALTAVGFDYDKVKDKSPLGFSGGEKRRIAIAGVLASRPKLLILDEPIAGLDPLGRIEFLNLIKRLNKEGTAVIMISHNADVLAEYADRIIVMENGHILCDDKADMVLCNHELQAKSGVGAGQVSDLVQKLRQKGVHISSNVMKYDQLIDALCSLYGRDDV